MKASKYNIYYREGKRFYVYNQLTCAFCEFDEELFTALKENSLSGVPEESEEELLRNHFVCDDTLQEEMILLKKNRDNRFGNRHAKITVMPTLDSAYIAESIETYYTQIGKQAYLGYRRPQ